MTGEVERCDQGALILEDVLLEINDRAVLTVNQVIPQGSVVAVTGQDGAVITDLLNHIVHQLRKHGEKTPVSGSIMEGSIRLHGPLAERASHVSKMTREHDLISGLSAAENVALELIAAKQASSAELIRAALDAVGLPTAVHHNLVEQLSGGQQQRVALARAMVVDAPVKVLDDPASELDPISRDVVYDALAQLANQGSIVIIGTPGSALGPEADITIRLNKGGRHVAQLRR